MISIKTVSRRLTTALVVATVAAIVASPAVAASKDDCAEAQAEFIARATSAAHVRLLAHQAHLVRTVVFRHRATLVALDRHFEALELRRWQLTRRMDEGPTGRHPLTVGIYVLATFARLPGQAAIAARQTLVALAKVAPRVLRAVL